MKAENKEVVQEVSKVKVTKILTFPSVAHNTIVRPRFVRGYELSKSKGTWTTKVINEKNQTIEDYCNDDFDLVEKKFQEFLKKY